MAAPMNFPLDAQWPIVLLCSFECLISISQNVLLVTAGGAQCGEYHTYIYNALIFVPTAQGYVYVCISVSVALRHQRVKSLTTIST